MLRGKSFLCYNKTRPFKKKKKTQQLYRFTGKRQRPIQLYLSQILRER